MKTQRNLFIALILTIVTSFAFTAFAYEGMDRMIIRVEQSDYNAIDVQLANLQKVRTEVNITDVKGKIWFQEYAWGVHGYAKTLKLEEMPPGEYVLLIRNRHQRYVQVFAKAEGFVVFFERVDEPRRGAVARLASNKPAYDSRMLISRYTIDGPRGVNIQMANLLDKKTVIQLKGMSGNTLYEEAIEGENGYAKRINLEKVANGNYYFLVHTGNTVQVQFLCINSKSLELRERQQLERRFLNESWAVK